MASLLKLKKSSVSGKVPLDTDLAYGELAINYSDGLLFYKTSNNGIASLGSQGVQGPLGLQGLQGVQGTPGSGLENWSRKTSNYVANNSDRIIADTSGGGFTVSLPGNPQLGATVTITDGSSFSTNNLVVSRNDHTIENTTNDVLLDISGTTYEFIYDGTTWHITASVGTPGVQGAQGIQGGGYDQLQGVQGTTGAQGVGGMVGTASPKITNIQVTDSSYVVIDDTAVDVLGGYIKITGTDFASGCQVIVNNVLATSTTFVSSTEVRAQLPATTAGTYVVYLVNSDGGVAIRVNGVTFSATPSWTTASSLPEGTIDSAISIQLAASSATTYQLQAGSTLPTGLSLNSSGLLSGTVTGIASDTTYNFTVVATDLENQDSPRTFSITIGVSDPYYYLTTLHLPGTGTNLAQNNTFLDSSTNNFTITRSGNTTQGTFSPFSQTGWGNYFDGSSYLGGPSSSSAFSFGTGAYTVECWVYFTSYAGSGNESVIFCPGNATNSIVCSVVRATGALTLSKYGSGSVISSSSGDVPLNTWCHLAFVRTSTASNDTKLYVNGVLKATGTDNNNWTVTTTSTIGALTLSNYGVTGYISNLRAVKGVAVYTGAFTPPTLALTATQSAGTNISAITTGQTVLLTCQSNRFVDNGQGNTGNTGFTITTSGSPSVQAFSPFAPNATYSAATHGGSAYFDGSDYLSVSSTYLPTTLWHRSEFTLEYWIYPFAFGGSVNSSNYSNVMGWGEPGTSGEAFSFGPNSSGLVVAYYYNGGQVYQPSSATLRLREWAHLAITGLNGVMTIYVNGANVGSFTKSGSVDASVPFLVGAMTSSGRFNGILSGIRLSTVRHYTSNFTLPTTPPGAVANTTLLLNFTNDAIEDATGRNVLETGGDARTTSAVTKWASQTSMYFDGTGDYLQLLDSELLEFGSADFTIEAWVYLTLLTGENRIILGHGENGNSWMAFYINDSGYLVFVSIPSVTAIVNRTATSRAVSLNTWTHVAASRNGSTFRLFIDGSEPTYSGSPSSTSSALPNFAAPFRIGAQRWTGESGIFQGYMQDLRITKGYARYTANFTPPTASPRLK